MTDNLRANQACFKTYQKNHDSDKTFACNNLILNEVFNLFIYRTIQHIYFKTLRLIGRRNKIQKLEFKNPETEETVIAKWSDLIHKCKLKNDSFFKLTKLSYATLYPSRFEK